MYRNVLFLFLIASQNVLKFVEKKHENLAKVRKITISVSTYFEKDTPL